MIEDHPDKLSVSLVILSLSLSLSLLLLFYLLREQNQTKVTMNTSEVYQAIFIEKREIKILIIYKGQIN